VAALNGLHTEEGENNLDIYGLSKHLQAGKEGNDLCLLDPRVAATSLDIQSGSSMGCNLDSSRSGGMLRPVSTPSVSPALPAAPVPLRWDDGVWRVGSTNLTLESVVQLYDAGLDADEIAREFAGLEVATAYQVIGYYLAHRDELADYLTARRTHVALQREQGKAAAVEMRARLAASA